MTDSNRKHRTVLIVEDEKALRELLTQFMETLGYRVRASANGRDGIEAIRSCSPAIDMVVLDIGLPDIGGDVVFDFIRRHHPALKVIVATGYARQQVAQELSRKADGFLEKPFSFAALAAKMNEILTEARTDGGRP